MSKVDSWSKEKFINMERAGVEKYIVVVPLICSSLVISRNSEGNFSHIFVILHIFLSLFLHSPTLSVGKLFPTVP